MHTVVEKFIMSILGYLHVDETPPQVREWVRLPFKVNRQMAMGETGVFCRDGQEIKSKWWKPTKNGDHLIREIEELHKMVNQTMCNSSTTDSEDNFIMLTTDAGPVYLRKSDISAVVKDRNKMFYTTKICFFNHCCNVSEDADHVKRLLIEGRRRG